MWFSQGLGAFRWRLSICSRCSMLQKYGSRRLHSERIGSAGGSRQLVGSHCRHADSAASANHRCRRAGYDAIVRYAGVCTAAIDESRVISGYACSTRRRSRWHGADIEPGDVN